MQAQVTSAQLTPLLRAMEENLHGHITFVQRSAAGMSVLDQGDLLLVDSGLPSDTFNKICRARLRDSDAQRRIPDAVRQFESLGRPFTWWVGPGSRPYNLESRLQDCGLTPVEFETGMAMDLRVLSSKGDRPANLIVKRACTSEEVADFSSVVAANRTPPDPCVKPFYGGSPSLLEEHCPMRLLVAYLDGKPVAAAELFIGAGVAGLYSMATLREMRGRGIGTSLLRATANHAFAAGMSTMTLQASEEGRNLYARFGFADLCQFAEYAPA